jgi:DNA-binding MarR family transcriptional regulator
MLTSTAVTRVSDPINRRRFVIELTSAGVTLLGRARKLGHEVGAEILGSLSERQLADLYRTLRQVVAERGILGGGTA